MKPVSLEEYLSKKVIKSEIPTEEEAGMVILLKENKGFFNRLFQKILKKPKFTKIHLDEMGSFIWPYLDGNCTIEEIGEKVKEHFGEKAEPLYERLIKYLKILESYGFAKIIE